MPDKKDDQGQRRFESIMVELFADPVIKQAEQAERILGELNEGSTGRGGSSNRGSASRGVANKQKP